MLYPDINLQKRTQQNSTRYRTALYLRLSREDGDKTESDSIANQRTLLEAYAADHPELCIVDEFVDDGYSGSNFERPAFQNLFRELEQGTINCVLVKDLSRFGRNYIEVGRYLERIFPVMRVRLIAVTDNYDSHSQSAWKTSDSIMVPMRNLLNDAYCRDISVKIKSQLAVKRKRGDFVGSFATYGYQKDPSNHTKLIVDELAAENVQSIFRWKISGMSNQGIADRLNARKVPSPAAQKLQSGAKLSLHFRKSDEPPWSAKAVDRILHNEVYIGKLVQGKTRRLDYRSKKKMNVPMRDWVIVDNTHEAVKEERKKWCRQRRENNPNIFKGRIFCKECGEKLFCHWQSDGTLYFYCASCHVSISEKDLWNGINKELHQRMEEHRDLQKLVRKSSGKSKLQSKEIAIKREIEQVSGNIVRLESQKRSGYEQYVLGKLSKEKFLELKQGLENEITTLKQTKAEKEKELAVVQEELQRKKQIAGSTEVLLMADNLQQYVKKIEVDRGKITYTEFLL